MQAVAVMKGGDGERLLSVCYVLVMVSGALISSCIEFSSQSYNVGTVNPHFTDENTEAVETCS